MDTRTATRTLAALSQGTRLEVFRLLVRAGTAGLAAGEIARAVSVPHNTLSSHLAILANAGLVDSRRDGRSIIYRVDFEGTRQLLAFLVEDCCQGRPEDCATMLSSVMPACCAQADSAEREITDAGAAA